MRRVALVAVALACAGCAGPPPPRTTADLPEGLFTVGYAAVSDRDAELVRAAQLAVRELNAAGGIGGAVEVELEIDEQGGEPGEAARRLVLEGVQALILSCEPEELRAQAAVADRTQVLAFAPCNEDPAIPERFGAVWPVSLGANAEAAALADHALTRQLSSVQVLGVWDEMLRYLAAAAAERGVEIVADGGDAVLGTHRVESGDPPEGVAFTAYGFPSEGSHAATFYDAYAQQYGRPPPASWAALGYDAVKVLAAAMTGAGSPDPFDMAERLAAGLAAEGAFGEIVYPGAGEHQPETAVVVVRVEDGERVLVEKSLPEEVPPP